MRRLPMAAVLAAQMAGAAQPASAAAPVEPRSQQTGAFAGFRLRVALDGNARQRPVRVALTLAPTLHSQRVDGAVRTRFGEGLELGVGNDRQPALTLAGTRVDRLGVRPSGMAPEGSRAGVSTVGWIAIGVGVSAVTAFALYGLCASGEICSIDDD